MKKAKYLFTIGVVYLTIIFGFTFFDGFRLLGNILSGFGFNTPIEMPGDNLQRDTDPIPPPPPPDGITG